MKDIEKYINNTKRKTKKAKLPALSTLHPTAVLPDGAAGIATFNASFGEDINNEFIEDLNNTIDASCRKFLLDKGFEEDQLDDIFDIEMETQADDNLSITVNADLTISSLRELADVLYPLIEKYDEDAYFDIATNKSISTEINVPMNLTEKLKYLDRRGFDLHCKDYGFEPLYEALKDRLDSEDKQKLKNFISTTDDPEKVNIFMKGLLMEEETPLREDVDLDDGETVSDTAERIIDDVEVIKNDVNNIITTANQYGLDVLRNSADLAIGALDDFINYMSDVQEAARQEDITVENPVENVETSVELGEAFEGDNWKSKISTHADEIIDRYLEGVNGYIEEEDGKYTVYPLGDNPLEYDNKDEMIYDMAYTLDEWDVTDIDNYTGNFFEYYPTPQDFEDATGLEYTKENIKDVVLDWVKRDLNDEIQDPVKIATGVAEKVIEE